VEERWRALEVEERWITFVEEERERATEAAVERWRQRGGGREVARV